MIPRNQIPLMLCCAGMEIIWRRVGEASTAMMNDRSTLCGVAVEARYRDGVPVDVGIVEQNVADGHGGVFLSGCDVVHGNWRIILWDAAGCRCVERLYLCCI